MRQYLAAALVIGLILTSFGGLPGVAEEPTTPESPGGSGETQRIGAYERVIGSDDLTLDHVEHLSDGLRVKGPSLTDTLRVESGFLAAELGPSWGASEAFSIDGDEIVVPAESVEFSPLELDSDPVFTMGGQDQIEFQERPMWVSVEQAEEGGQITLEMDDGDTTGQSVYIAKEWLWNRGIHRPVAVHEDGTNLTAVATEERDGWMIEMHHFTYMEITATDQLVYSRQDGIIVPHTDETRWYEDERRLEIDVGYTCASHVTLAVSASCSSIDQDVFVDKDWLDMKIDHLALQTHVWEVESHNLRGFGEDDYYMVSLTSSQTPTTIVYTEFDPSDGRVYTGGSFETVKLFNPMMIEVTSEIGQVDILHSFVDEDLFPQSSVMLNVSWLISNGIEKPRIFAGEFNTTTYSVMEGMLQYSIDFSQALGSSVQNDETLVGSIVADVMAASKCQSHLGSEGIVVAEFDDDHGNGGTGTIYLLGATFCFEWEVVVPADVWDDWTSSYTVNERYFSAAYGIYDPNTGLACGDGTENNKDVTGESGWATCTWDHEATLPSDLKYAFMVTMYGSLEDTKETTTQSKWACVAGGAATTAGLAAITIWAPPISLAVAVGGVAATVAACSWMVWEAAQAGVLCCDVHQAQAQVLTAPPGYVYVPDTVFWVDVHDMDNRRVDTWDIVEENVDIRGDDWDGEQTIEWMVKNVETRASVTYTPDISILYGEYHWPTGDVDFDEHIIGRDVGQNFVKFESLKNSFSDPAEIIIGALSSHNDGLDWQAPNTACTLEMKIISSAGTLKILSPGQFEWNPVLCGGDDDSEGFFVPPIDDPDYPNLPLYDLFPNAPQPVGIDDGWIEFVADAPELGVHKELMNVSMQDVINANSSLPRAYALAAVGPGEYVDNISEIQVFPMNSDEENQFPIQGVESCNEWEDPYEGSFEGVIKGAPLFGNIDEVKDRTIEDTLICFDPTTLSIET